MKKKLLLALTLLTFVFGGCSPAYESLEMEYDLTEWFSKITNATSSETVPIPVHETDNETPYQDLITKEIDIHEFAQKYYGGQLNSSDIRTLSAELGIECLRETEEGSLYSVHKVKQGGLLYIFYNNMIEDEDTAKRCHHNIIESYYVQKKLSSKDFASIKEGSTITDVKKIDPTAQIWENLYKADSEVQKLGWQEIATIHYLSDGILRCVLKETDAGELKVERTDLYSEFRLLWDVLVCKVLDQDLLR